jgi:hypothetical protein
LWSVLMLQSWLENEAERSACPPAASELPAAKLACAKLTCAKLT